MSRLGLQQPVKRQRTERKAVLPREGAIWKLQKASYHQAAEKWDSDSDSDESDEEDLKM